MPRRNLMAPAARRPAGFGRPLSCNNWFIVPASPSGECPGIKLRSPSRFASSTTVNYVPVTVVRLRKGVRMNLLRILPLACLLSAGAAQAQSACESHVVPGDRGLSWDALAGDDLVFCKALRSRGGEGRGLGWGR